MTAAHQDLAVQHVEVEDGRDVAVGEALQPLELAAGVRLDGDHLRLRVRLLEPPADAHQGAPCAQPGDEDVDLREVFQDFGPRGPVMGADVERVRKLVHDDPATATRQLARLRYRPAHPLSGGHPVDAGAERR